MGDGNKSERWFIPCLTFILTTYFPSYIGEYTGAREMGDGNKGERWFIPGLTFIRLKGFLSCIGELYWSERDGRWE